MQNIQYNMRHGLKLAGDHIFEELVVKQGNTPSALVACSRRSVPNIWQEWKTTVLQLQYCAIQSSTVQYSRVKTTFSNASKLQWKIHLHSGSDCTVCGPHGRVSWCRYLRSLQGSSSPSSSKDRNSVSRYLRHLLKPTFGGKNITVPIGKLTRTNAQFNHKLAHVGTSCNESVTLHLFFTHFFSWFNWSLSVNQKASAAVTLISSAAALHK